MILCWYAFLEPLKNDALFKAGLSRLIFEKRREDILDTKNRGVQIQSLGAGLLLMHALEEAGVRDFSLFENPYGKPYLCSKEKYFSLSHTKGIAVCAVSDQEVGADTEEWMEAKMKIAERFFHPDEILWLKAQADINTAFTRLWTRKESYVKLIGEGLSRPLNSFCAIESDPSQHMIFHETEVRDYCITVCSANGEPVLFRQYRFQ